MISISGLFSPRAVQLEDFKKSALACCEHPGQPRPYRRRSMSNDNAIPPNHKRCKTCDEIKPATAEYFYTHTGCKDGLKNQCKTCVIERQRRWNNNNREIIAEHNRQYYEKNRENESKRQRHWREINRENISEHGRRYYEKNREKA